MPFGGKADSMAQLYPTPHINATPKDIAETVLMPGDPLRSRFIAENFLDSPILFNNVRNVQGYTGTYRGTRVSVMASGMGMPSISIYSTELFRFFGVENIIRVGSAGAMREDVRVRDIVIAVGACTNSSFFSQYRTEGSFAPIASYPLVKTADAVASEMGLKAHFGNVFSSDVFYNDDPEVNAKWARLGVLAVEMECAALYTVAAREGKNALGILTVSDHLITSESTTAEERQTSFTDMMKLSLETAVRL